jgi:hypothetical protein
MAPTGADGLNAAVYTFWAHEMGWVRIRSLGPNVWERPDGSIVHHKDDSEPLIQAVYVMGAPDWLRKPEPPKEDA